MIKEDGFANEFIIKKRNEIVEKLKQFNIICRFTSSDGDKYYNIEHEIAFSKYQDKLENGASMDEIEQIVIDCISEGQWPISDILHLFKNIRVKTLFRKIGINLLSQFDPLEFDKFIQFKSCLKDKTSQGSMKDSYPLTLYGFESFMNSICYENSHFLITPFF